MRVDKSGMNEVGLSPLNHPLERPVSRGSKYQTTADEKQFTLGLNRDSLRPLHFVQVQGIFPSSFRYIQLDILPESRLSSHQNQDPVLTSVEAVGLTLFNGECLFVSRFTEPIDTDLLFIAPSFASAGINCSLILSERTGHGRLSLEVSCLIGSRSLRVTFVPVLIPITPPAV